MENPNDHHKNEEEIQEVELNNHEEDPADDSYASDYEWEREMQELWRQFDEAFEEMNRAPQENIDASTQEEEVVKDEFKLGSS